MVRTLLAIAVVGLVAGAIVGAAARPAAADSHCPDPDGAADQLPDHPEPDPDDGAWAVQGRGWGHGVGLSQYGAQGAARLGCGAATILTTYFSGTEVTDLSAADQSDEVRVSLFPTRAGAPMPETVTVTAMPEYGDLQWQLPEEDTDDGTGPATTVSQPEGATWRLGRHDGHFVLRDADGDGAEAEVWAGAGSGDPVELPLSGPGAMIAQLAEKPNPSFPDGTPYAEGTLHFDPVGEDERDFLVNVTIPGRDGDAALDRYLLGLAEVPSSWPVEALKAQAIAGRGYAARTIAQRRDAGIGVSGCGDCDLYDSAVDQVYAGHAKVLGAFGDQWRQAVLDSGGQVLVDAADEIAVTFYSSSHGGHSETAVFSGYFGTVFDPAYLQPVDDSRWEIASDNPNLAWSETFTAAQVTDAAEAAAQSSSGDDGFESELPIGRPESVTVTVPDPTGAGGRVGDPRQDDPDTGEPYGGVRVEGDEGFAVVSGKAFVDALGVARRSELFDVRGLGSGDGSGDGDSDGDGGDGGDGDGGGDEPDPGELVSRLAGTGRIETAATAARAGWPDGADHVVLARADEFADALAAAALANVRDAPLVLTPSHELAPAAADVLADLAPESATVMGGEAAIEGSVVDAVEQRGVGVTRVAGAQRFATAAETARVVAETATAGSGGVDEVVLALGTDWADALAAGALAAGNRPVPTLLGLTDEIPAATREALADLDPDRVTLVGGTGVIDETVADRLAADGYDVARLGGATRWATSAQVAGEALHRTGRDTAVLASGQAFPDALAAGAFAARADGVVVLVPSSDLSAAGPVATLLGDGPLADGYLLGGTSAVSESVRHDAGHLMSEG